MDMAGPIPSRASSPVAVGSPTESQAGKRKRASKPKVRTGCITCKIRRVKCGEEKPACVRCTSTGRTCDGYDKGAPPRNRSLESQRNAERAKLEFFKAYQWNEAFRSMRPIVADIDGTESEKSFFRRFRVLAADGLADHVCHFTSFWSRVVPQISRQDEAIKHAVIALGAACRVSQLSHENCNETRRDKALQAASPDDLTHEDLEVFTIQQYNKSISNLQRHVGSSSPESIEVTLICCLSFICLETLRGHLEAAMTHLVNGLNILESLPLSDFDFLSDLGDDGSNVAGPRASPYPAQVGLRDIIDLFGRLEINACFFTAGVRPIVAERGYAHRRLDDGSSSAYPSEFRSSRQAHRAYHYFLRDVLAQLYDTNQSLSTLPSWPHPHQLRQQQCLRLRAARLDSLMQKFLCGPYCPPPDTTDHYCIHLDLLNFRAAQILLAGMDMPVPGQIYSCGLGYSSYSERPSSPSTTSTSTPSPSYSGGATTPSFTPSPLPPDRTTTGVNPSSQPHLDTPTTLQSDLLRIASLLHASKTARDLCATSESRFFFFADAATVGAVYLAAVTATDPAVRARARRLIDESGGLDRSGFFWDGPALRQRLGLAADPGLSTPAWDTGMGGGGGGGGGVGLDGVGSAPLVQDALERLEALRVEMR